MSPEIGVTSLPGLASLSQRKLKLSAVFWSLTTSLASQHQIWEYSWSLVCWPAGLASDVTGLWWYSCSSTYLVFPTVTPPPSLYAFVIRLQSDSGKLGLTSHHIDWIPSPG